MCRVEAGQGGGRIAGGYGNVYPCAGLHAACEDGQGMTFPLTVLIRQYIRMHHNEV